MVVVRLAGGLGNQMFQYAAGCALARQWQTELKLDLSFYSQQALRTYSLQYFKIQPRFAEPKEVGRLIGTSGHWVKRWANRLAEALKPEPSPSVINERHYLIYDPQLFGKARDIYLIGYWQNERYFASAAEILRDEFTLSQALLPENDAVARQIASVTAIGVHVRRGDYVANKRTSEIHGVCTEDYYHVAARSLISQIPTAHFFVFSDDPEWVKCNLHLGGPTTIVEPTVAERDCEQLLLLSQCQHLILANSTFSWWAAWLGQRQDRLLYAPKQWFVQDVYDTREFIPEAWIRT